MARFQCKQTHRGARRKWGWKNVNVHHAPGHDILTKYMVATCHIYSEEKTNEWVYL